MNNPQAEARSDCKNLSGSRVPGFSPGYRIITISLPCGNLSYSKLKELSLNTVPISGTKGV